MHTVRDAHFGGSRTDGHIGLYSITDSSYTIFIKFSGRKNNPDLFVYALDAAIGLFFKQDAFIPVGK